MKTKKGFIGVQVDLQQKKAIQVGDKLFSLVPKYSVNHREKNPCVAVVVEVGKEIKKGTLIICHHHFFRDDSPYRVYDNFFSIPIGRQIFMSIDENGEAHGMNGNVIAERIKETSLLTIPASYQKNYLDRVIVVSSGEGLMKGDEILTKKMADYEIVYMWDNVEKRIIRIFWEDVVAVLQK